jgi:hypothetical protein
MFNDLAYLTNYNYYKEYSEVSIKDNVLVAKVLMPNTVKEDIKVALTDKLLKVFKEGRLAYYLDVDKYKFNKDKCSCKYEGEMLYITLPLLVEEEFVIKLE